MFWVQKLLLGMFGCCDIKKIDSGRKWKYILFWKYPEMFCFLSATWYFSKMVLHLKLTGQYLISPLWFDPFSDVISHFGYSRRWDVAGGEQVSQCAYTGIFLFSLYRAYWKRDATFCKIGLGMIFICGDSSFSLLFFEGSTNLDSEYVKPTNTHTQK